MSVVSATSYGAIGSQLLDYPCPHTSIRRYSSARLTCRRAILLVDFFCYHEKVGRSKGDGKGESDARD